VWARGTDSNASPTAPSLFVDSKDYPTIAEITGEIVYARLQRGAGSIETGLRAQGARPMGGTREGLGIGRRPGGSPGHGHCTETGREAPRRVRLLYS
jgi:hypothetical protein